MSMSTDRWEENRRFNAWLSSLSTKSVEVGETADGATLTVEVPSFGIEK